MKYGIRIGSVQSNIDATDDYAAVDVARESHVIPPEGGDFEVVVMALEPCMTTSGKMRPPGEVSRFTVRHEPTEAMRAEIEIASAMNARDVERARLRAEIRAEIESENAANANR